MKTITNLPLFLIYISYFTAFAQHDNTNFESSDQMTEVVNSIESLVTDRPDATEASSTVGKGVFQVETGAFYESFKDNNNTYENFTFNTTLLRYGILDNLELRLGWDFVEGVTKINGDTS